MSKKAGGFASRRKPEKKENPRRLVVRRTSAVVAEGSINFYQDPFGNTVVFGGKTVSFSQIAKELENQGLVGASHLVHPAAKALGLSDPVVPGDAFRIWEKAVPADLFEPQPTNP